MLPNVAGLDGFEASRHADLYFNNDCDGNCYFNAKGGVSEIFFWELD